MSKTAVISCRVDEELLATLDRLAAAYERSRSWVVYKLLTDAAAAEFKELEFLEEGFADIDAGRTILHEDLMCDLQDEFGYGADSKAA